MPVRTTIPEKHGIYFITFTCARWLPLFEITNSYDLVYNWLRHLLCERHYVIAYVIMPNHVHVLIAFRNTEKTINSIIANGKRFIAYELVKRLEKQGQTELLKQMQHWVNTTDRKHNKKHEVFEPSFDWKECISEDFLEQKLNYIHENPCKGEKSLADNPQDYEHSSAKEYITGDKGSIAITTYQELEDIDLSEIEYPQSPSGTQA